MSEQELPPRPWYVDGPGIIRDAEKHYVGGAGLPLIRAGSAASVDRLFAAAPELAEALQGVMRLLIENTDIDLMMLADMPAYVAANNALARARGEAVAR